MKNKPKWWPQNPYPIDLFPMDDKTAADYLPSDPMARTAIAGALGRRFWDIASQSILDRYLEELEVSDE